MKMTVTLSHGPNPDIDGGYWDTPADSGRPVEVEVGSAGFAKASRLCREYCARNGLGGGNWTGGAVRVDGIQVATISYNGRVWDIKGQEIKSEVTQ